ncbi:hypothetical protein [Streptomyces sp. NPDC046988]|uniref:hypothetical protein n=1 Tax=Streptomyces sp. NPDC046988 TaxID=3154922 RepID=UPI0033F6ECCA
MSGRERGSGSAHDLQGDDPDATVAANPFAESLSTRLAGTLSAPEPVTSGMAKLEAELSETTHAAGPVTVVWRPLWVRRGSRWT